MIGGAAESVGYASVRIILLRPSIAVSSPSSVIQAVAKLPGVTGHLPAHLAWFLRFMLAVRLDLLPFCSDTRALLLSHTVGVCFGAAALCSLVIV